MYKKEKCWRKRFAVIHKEERKNVFEAFRQLSFNHRHTHSHWSEEDCVYLSIFIIPSLDAQFQFEAKEKESIRVVKELKEEFLKDSD